LRRQHNYAHIQYARREKLGSGELELVLHESVQGVEGCTDHAILELSAIRVHLELPRRCQILEGDEDLADAISDAAYINSKGCEDTCFGSFGKEQR